MTAEVVQAERRDPRGATKPMHFTMSPGTPQVSEWDAAQAWRLGVLANVIAYRCVQLRARALASVPWVTGRKQGQHTTIVEDHPLTKLLGPPPGGPAPKLSATKLFRWTHAQEIVTGARAWEIETHDGRPDGRPVAFWPLAINNLRAFPSTSGTEWFRLFETGPSHDPIRLQPGNVFYGWEPSGLDFRQPSSDLQSLRYDLSLVTLADRYGVGFLRNNAVPAAVVTTAKFPTDAARSAFIGAWSAEFGGPDNAGRVALNEVEDGEGPVSDSIHVEVLGVSQRDARLLETRKEMMIEIAIGLGTPWSKLDASGRTFDNAESEDRDWWENTLLADLTDLQDDINMHLTPRLGTGVGWFDLRGVRALRRRLFPVDGGDRVELLDRGVVTPNEVRADADLDPLADGDEPLRPLVAPPAPPAEAKAAIEAKAAPVAQQRSPEPPVPAPDLDAIEARRASIWRAAEATVTSLEARWERALRRMFERQRDATLARLEGKRGRQAVNAETREADPGGIFDLSFWTALAVENVVDLYEDVVTLGAGKIAAKVGIAFDLAQPGVVDFIMSRANQLAGQVTQTTYDAIQAAMTDGVQAGEGIPEIAERIKHVFAVASDSRATTIARTEVISAYNGAQVLAASTMPTDVIAAQEWIATRDGRTRPEHAAADGQVVAIGSPFSVGGDDLAYPGDPAGRAANTIQCRCTVAFLDPEEYAEAQERAPLLVETRAAALALRLVRKGDELDLLGFRRALEGAAA